LEKRHKQSPRTVGISPEFLQALGEERVQLSKTVQMAERMGSPGE